MPLKDKKDESSLSLHGIEFHIFGPINEKALLPINVDVGGIYKILVRIFKTWIKSFNGKIKVSIYRPDSYELKLLF